MFNLGDKKSSVKEPFGEGEETGEDAEGDEEVEEDGEEELPGGAEHLEEEEEELGE